MTINKNDYGICMFAYNTPELDYVKFSLLAALLAKKHMKNVPVTLITTKGDKEWLFDSHDHSIINSAIDNFVVEEQVEHKSNIRTHWDSPWTSFKSEFKNSNKHQVFELSPYQKTLLIDTDFLIFNDCLLQLFNNDNSLALYKTAKALDLNPPHLNEQILSDGSEISMLWSTVIYFEKTEYSKLFFDLWKHVSENYDFYKQRYQLPGKLYRTDYAVTISDHIMSNFGANNSQIINLPDEPMMYLDQKDDISKCYKDGSMLCLVTDRKENWKSTITKHEKTNIHVMNKRAIERHYNSLIEYAILKKDINNG